MQQPITRRDVYEPSLKAEVNGREVEAFEASIDRSLPDPLLGGSMTAASGDFTAVEGPDVSRTVTTPWDVSTQWPPVGESTVELSMDVGSGPVKSMTNGKVLGSGGSTDSRGVEVEFSDRFQSLDKSISWPPLRRAMPAHDMYGWDWTKMRYVSLISEAVTDTILRHCGWYITPPMIGYTALSVPANGSMWPESGASLIAGRAEGGYPKWSRAYWGISVADFVGTYQLGGNYSIKNRGRVEMCVMTGQNGEYSRVSVDSESGAGLFRLQWTASQVQLYVRDPDGAYRQAVVVPRSVGLAYATIEYVTDTMVSCTLSSGSSKVTETFTCSATATTSIARTADFVIQSESSGFQVAFPSTSRGIEDWVSNVNMNPRTHDIPNLVVRPPVEGENCLDLLKAQAEAEASTFWIDEKGILQWWDLSRLEGRDSVATLTSDTDITDKGFSWEHTDSAIKSRVMVKWTDVLTDWHPTWTITMHQGSGETVQPGAASEPKEAWIDVPDNEIWIMVDTNFQRVGTNDMLAFNQGVGSWYGAVIPGKTDEEPDYWAYNSGHPDQGSFLMTIEEVSPTAFKTTVQWTGSAEVVQKTPGLQANSGLWRVRREVDLPIIRGKAKLSTARRMTYSAQNGPTTAPEHEIDAGWWIQLPEQAQYLADYAGARLTVPQPVLSSISLIPVPGLQLGDVVTVEDTEVTRLTIRGIVMEDSRSFKSDMTFDHSVMVRPTYVTRNGVTWHEWATVVRDKTWAQWATDQGGTWQQWGENPLLKEEVV